MKNVLKAVIICILFLFLSSLNAYACTVFQVTDEAGNVRCGRNFDWNKEGGTIWFIPAQAEDHGFLIIEQEGFDYPYEGMNDQGLFIAIAAVPKTKIPFSILSLRRVYSLNTRSIINKFFTEFILSETNVFRVTRSFSLYV